MRDLLGKPDLSDAEAEAIRDACRQWVEFAFETWEYLGRPNEPELIERSKKRRESALDARS
jgi:hypothetical protein